MKTENIFPSCVLRRKYQHVMCLLLSHMLWCLVESLVDSSIILMQTVPALFNEVESASAAFIYNPDVVSVCFI